MTESVEELEPAGGRTVAHGWSAHLVGTNVDICPACGCRIYFFFSLLERHYDVCVCVWGGGGGGAGLM